MISEKSSLKQTGAFFCFEGIEGAGKSTLISLVANLLRDSNIPSILTREPGGTELGKKIREILLQSTDTHIAPITELLLFFADRAQHLNEKILPAVQEKQVVLSDRFYYSTIAYQCFGRGLSRNVVDSLIEISLDSFKPDGIILVDLPVMTGLERASKRSALDRFEKEDTQFHERIRKGFLDLAKENKERFLVLDGTKSPKTLANLSFQFITHKLSNPEG